jgi:hypothetical protein
VAAPSARELTLTWGGSAGFHEAGHHFRLGAWTLFRRSAEGRPELEGITFRELPTR